MYECLRIIILLAACLVRSSSSAKRALAFFFCSSQTSHTAVNQHQAEFFLPNIIPGLFFFFLGGVSTQLHLAHTVV